MTGHLEVPASEPDSRTRRHAFIANSYGRFAQTIWLWGPGGYQTRWIWVDYRLFRPGRSGGARVSCGRGRAAYASGSGRCIRRAVGCGRIGAYHARTTGPFGAADSAGQGKAGIEQQSAGGSGCVECEVWQRRVSSGSAGNSDRGITLLRDTAHRLPLDGTKPLGPCWFHFMRIRSLIRGKTWSGSCAPGSMR